MESVQETLFDDPIGLRFKSAREKARFSKESVAQQLRLPVAVIAAIESEDWASLGAPIYVRSYVGSYAKLLGLPSEFANEVAQSKPTPPLNPFGGGISGRHIFDRGVHNLAYLVMTAVIVGSVIMLAMHFNSPQKMLQAVPLDAAIGASDNTIVSVPAAKPAAPGTSDAEAIASAPTSTAAQSSTQTPVMASLTPSLLSANVQHQDNLLLRFRAQSWVDIVDATGQGIERGLVTAGSERRYSPGQVARITLGNADAVDVSVGGRAVDLAPYRNANIARFAVSSAGQLSPPGG